MKKITLSTCTKDLAQAATQNLTIPIIATVFGVVYIWLNFEYFVLKIIASVPLVALLLGLSLWQKKESIR